MRRFVWMVVAALAVAGAVSAQDKVGTIEGQVTSKAGAALPGVTVTATSTLLKQPRVVSTNAEGTYLLSGMPAPGDYMLTFSVEGYATGHATVSLKVDQTARQNVVLEPAVSGEKPPGSP